MKNLFAILALISLFFFISCNSEQSNEDEASEVAAIEEAVEEAVKEATEEDTVEAIITEETEVVDQDDPSE